MKLFTFFTIFIMSSLAHSQTLSQSEGRLVIKAVRESINRRSLECFDKVNGRQGFGSHHSALIGAFKDSTVEVREGEQPVVIITSISTEDDEVVTLVETNPDFTEVTQFSIQIAKLSKVERNVGTILRPRFEVKLVRKTLEEIDCR